jgi:hypothetical protein
MYVLHVHVHVYNARVFMPCEAPRLLSRQSNSRRSHGSIADSVRKVHVTRYRLDVEKSKAEFIVDSEAAFQATVLYPTDRD